VHVTLVGDDIAELESDWSSLAGSDPEATPFSSFQWASVWLRHWADGGTPWVLAVHEGGLVEEGGRVEGESVQGGRIEEGGLEGACVVGLAPFVLHRRGGLRLLRGLGVGVGNYWDVLAVEQSREQVLAAIASALRERSAEWDALFIDKLPEGSKTEGALAAAGLRIGWRSQSPSPRIELPATFDDYLARLSQNRRQKVRRNLRVIDSGEMTVGVVSDPQELRTAIDRWQALRVEWWAQRGQAMQEEHGSPRFLAFTQEVIADLVAVERALVWEVRHRGDLIGIAINFLDDTAFYYWLWGFDLRVEKLRPGHTLIAHCIRWSIETGRGYFDFMIGDEPYKSDYAPTERAVISVDVGNRTSRSRAALGLARLKRAV
jgi:CelD/BcsL family acetyltransferase involved in cellulose biosynthesis